MRMEPLYVFAEILSTEGTFPTVNTQRSDFTASLGITSSQTTVSLALSTILSQPFNVC